MFACVRFVHQSCSGDLFNDVFAVKVLALDWASLRPKPLGIVRSFRVTCFFRFCHVRFRVSDQRCIQIWALIGSDLACMCFISQFPPIASSRV